MKLITTGTLNGARTYRSEDGRFAISSTVHETRDKVDRVTRTRWWTVSDRSRRFAEVARGTTLAVCKARLAKYLAAESA